MTIYIYSHITITRYREFPLLQENKSLNQSSPLPSPALSTTGVFSDPVVVPLECHINVESYICTSLSLTSFIYHNAFETHLCCL